MIKINIFISFDHMEEECMINIDFNANFLLPTLMGFVLQITEVQGCIISSSLLNGKIPITVNPADSVPEGHGYIEFVKQEYQVPASNNRIKLRLRRRGSFGRKKESEIFTRDRDAEEGKHYFCEGNNAGLIRFGPTEFYKDIAIRIGQRGIVERAFSVELGNNEGSRDLKRNYETRVIIDPIHYQDIGETSNYMQDEVETDFDIESIESDIGITSLEQLDNLNFLPFDTSLVTQQSFQSDMFKFDKAQYNYWFEHGVIEIPVHSETPATWVVNFSKSLLMPAQFRHTTGNLIKGYNLIEIPISPNPTAQLLAPTAFGLEVTDDHHEVIEACIVLRVPPLF